jgi:large subunit ribosomal protein L35
MKQKLKTHKGAAKRFKVTGTGKITRSAAYKRHMLTSKPTKRKRHMQGNILVDPGDAAKVRRMLPYE